MMLSVKAHYVIIMQHPPARMRTLTLTLIAAASTDNAESAKWTPERMRLATLVARQDPCLMECTATGWTQVFEVGLIQFKAMSKAIATMAISASTGLEAPLINWAVKVAVILVSGQNPPTRTSTCG